MHAYLFVPANQPKRIIKALTDPIISHHVNGVIIDLEDAVEGDNPQQIRDQLTALLSDTPSNTPKIWVRIHGVTHDEFGADIDFVKKQLAIYGVVLPKVDTAKHVAIAHELTERPIIAMIESGQGVLNLGQIAQVHGVMALSYGCLDLLTSLNVAMHTNAGQTLLDKIRTDLVLHSHAHGLSAPIETIYPNFIDDDGFMAWLTHAQNFGFGGVLAIHPKQLAIINSLSQDDANLCFAKKVIAHHKKTGQSIFAIDGQMVDLPVIEQAKQLTSKHNASAP